MAARLEEMERLVRERERALLGYAYVVCGDPHLAQDLVQDALVKTFSRPRAGLPPSRPRRTSAAPSPPSTSTSTGASSAGRGSSTSSGPEDAQRSDLRRRAGLRRRDRPRDPAAAGARVHRLEVLRRPHRSGDRRQLGLAQGRSSATSAMVCAHSSWRWARSRRRRDDGCDAPRKGRREERTDR